ncbi:MAG: alpha-glucosidase [Ginsengibacter sp.]
MSTDKLDLQKKWWKKAVVYQIYPRSFKDSNKDGIGDLRGIISKLNYIKSLGIDIVWLNPINKSPNDDNGYDISDYEAIMEEFGTMQDFDELLSGLHERNIKLVMDLVVNHSSDEHRWFVESRKSRDNPYRDYYHWWPAEKGEPPFRKSFFDVNGQAWEYDAVTDSYYLHYFSIKQPDLNWENPKLRKEIYDMMIFWIDKGIDGFRMDVITFISKDINFPTITKEYLNKKYNGSWTNYYAHGPKLHKYLKEINKEVLSKYDVMTVAEGAGLKPADALKFVDEDMKKLDMLYHFDGTNLGYLPNQYKHMDPQGFNLVAFKEIYTKWNKKVSKKGWGTIYLGNHDQPRMISRWGNDAPEYREASSKMLTTFLLSMRGTPYYYAGDEIGMSNIKFNNIDDYRDIETLNMYKKIKNKNGDVQYFLDGQKISARDNGRTPFQWNGEENAGFTKGIPWLKVHPDYQEVNVALQENDSGSALNYFRKMIRLRKALPELVYGSYHLVDKDNPNVYAYTRKFNDQKVLILLNFSSREILFRISSSLGSAGDILINNLPDIKRENKKLYLQPYQAIIMRLH